MMELQETLVELNATEVLNAFDSVGMQALFNTGNFTIFAPTNAAFKDLKPEKVSAIQNVSTIYVNFVCNIRNMSILHAMYMCQF